MKYLLLILCFTTFLSACSHTQNKNLSSKPKSSGTKALPEVHYYGDMAGSGNYSILNMDNIEAPTPVQGKTEWMMEFYKSIKYPATARESGIQGIVTLNVFVDQIGKVTKVEVLKGLSDDCDAEARRAFLDTTTKGYTPLMVDGVPIHFRMEYPVGFWLH